MATAYSVLGQLNPAATTSVALVTATSSSEVIVSTITVCNQASTAGTFRITVRENDAALDGKQYIAYDTPIAANDTIALTLGITLNGGDKIYVYGSSANLSYNAFGSVIS